MVACDIYWEELLKADFSSLNFQIYVQNVANDLIINN